MTFSVGLPKQQGSQDVTFSKSLGKNRKGGGIERMEA